METKNADLSALRINRGADPTAAPSGSRAWMWVAVATGGAVLVAALLLTRGTRAP